MGHGNAAVFKRARRLRRPKVAETLDTEPVVCVPIPSQVKAKSRTSVGTDSIMRLVAITILLAVACFSPGRSQKTEISAKEIDIAPALAKLDKNLRQVLLKTLTDLEAESAEQRKDEDEKSLIMTAEKSYDEVVKRNLNKNLGVISKASFSFNGFPGDEEIPNEEKLQNSSFIESKKYASSSATTIEKASRDDAGSFHVHNIIVPDKTSTTHSPRTESKVDSLELRKTSASSSSVSKIDSITLKPITQISESLTQSASSRISSANTLIAPKPTASSPTVSPKSNVTLEFGKKEKVQAEEVKIFQAPLVAAFTVQQDELGVPKSVVPIYRQTGDGQALTLQEQLEFKQKLLEQQLAELQQQQIHQTQFLIRQRQLYEQQLRQKQQQQQLYLQEQARIKQFEEQAKIKQLEEQRFKQLEQQRIYHLQQQNHFPLQKQQIFEQANFILPLQPSLESAVHLQPSVSLELPTAASPPLFRTNYQEQQLHFQQLRQQPQQLHQQPQQLHQQPPQPLQQPQQPHQQLQQSHQQLQQSHQQLQQSHQQLQQSHQQLQQPHQQLQQPHQQRLQNFVSFPTDFQPPVVPATRFNRQEAFNAVGNFGFNLDNKQSPPSKNTFNFNVPARNPSTFVYNPYVQYRQVPVRAQTPAKQIQRLLYQSGVAGELGNVQGPGAEDLNIVSKVLALHVGALPNKNYQFSTSNRGKLNA
ncbi:PAX-interacting protein 1-like [Linepithema humile]|uniref:PAX-interacting protein 1-like n=1 Tax=Linepithema humile TaxID=83485 RepID=UPI00351DFFC8